MSDKVVRLEFGVLGGGQITGQSGKQILKDIKEITNAINKDDSSKIYIKLDTDSILGNAKENIEKTTKSALSGNKSLNTEVKKQYSLLRKADGYIGKYGSGLTRIGKINSFNSLREQINKGNITAKDAEEQLAKLQVEAKQLGAESQTAGEKFKSLFNIDFKSIVKSLSAQMLRNTLQEVYQSVVNLDEAVVNLSMVTGDNREKTKELVASYSEMAQKFGSVTSEVASAADDWLRQGYSLEETNSLVETSMVLSKIGLIDSAEATQYLTSATKGYKIEASDAITVADKLSAVDMAAAVSVSGLAEGMSKTANSARLAGVEMDTLLGYLAAVGEVTQQDMGSVGNAFKTMFARYSNVKLNKLEDDDGESLNDYERSLSRVGITLRDNLGTFREFDDVLADVQEKWSSLSDVDKSAIATALGATRQKENVFTLMENYSKAMDYADISANSAGTAMEKYDAYSQGIEANINRVKASFESLSSNLLNSELVIGATKLANIVLKTADGLAECKMLLPLILGSVMSIKNVGLSNTGGIYPQNALMVTLNELPCGSKRALGKTVDTGACKKRIAA